MPADGKPDANGNASRAMQGLALEDYDNVIGFIVSKTAHVLKRCLEEAFLQGGVPLQAKEFPVLNRLHQYKTLTQTELCELTYPDHPAMTRMLDRLMKLGFVRKKTAANDRRAFDVSLTGEGRAMREKAAGVVSDMLQVIADGVSDEELRTTIRVLRRIHDQADTHEVRMVGRRIADAPPSPGGRKPRAKGGVYASKWASGES